MEILKQMETILLESEEAQKAVAPAFPQSSYTEAKIPAGDTNAQASDLTNGLALMIHLTTLEILKLGLHKELRTLLLQNQNPSSTEQHRSLEMNSQ